MKLTIITKQLIKNGKWNCSTTHDCYDVYEAADTVEGAQQKISDTLRRRGYTGEIFFESPKPYVKSEQIFGQCVPTYIFGIDKGMV